MTDRIHPAGEKITDDDATIEAALEDVSIPTLLLSMVHMSGDVSILERSLRPQGIFLNALARRDGRHARHARGSLVRVAGRVSGPSW